MVNASHLGIFPAVVSCRWAGLVAGLVRSVWCTPHRFLGPPSGCQSQFHALERTQAVITPLNREAREKALGTDTVPRGVALLQLSRFSKKSRHRCQVMEQHHPPSRTPIASNLSFQPGALPWGNSKFVPRTQVLTSLWVRASCRNSLSFTLPTCPLDKCTLGCASPFQRS